MMRPVLLIDRHAGTPHWGPDPDQRCDVLGVPPHPCALRLPLQDPAVCEPLAAVGEAPALHIEPLGDGRLLVAPTPGLALLVDGRRAPPLVRLAPGQRLDLPPGASFYVSSLVGSRPGPAAPGQAGLPCAFCRTEILAGDTVWTCPRCGTALHQQGEDIPEDQRLLCSEAVSRCPGCDGPPQRSQKEGGLSFDPRRV